MSGIICSSNRIFELWVLLCRKFQTHESRLKQNDILFHPLLILKIPFSKENFNLNNKFFIVQKNLRWQNLANLLWFEKHPWLFQRFFCQKKLQNDTKNTYFETQNQFQFWFENNKKNEFSNLILWAKREIWYFKKVRFPDI